jgi:hypothetical protein
MRQQAEKRRVEAFSLYLGGTPVAEIADKLGVGHSSIWRYLNRELAGCRLANSQKVDLIREQVLHRLNRVYDEALAAFGRSCRSGNTKSSLKVREASDGAFREELVQIERGPGDARYLQIALDALNEVGTLYGLVSDESTGAIGANGRIRIATCFGGENLPVENAANAIATSEETPTPPGGPAPTTGAESIVTPGEKGHSNAVAGKALEKRG